MKMMKKRMKEKEMQNAEKEKKRVRMKARKLVSLWMQKKKRRAAQMKDSAPLKYALQWTLKRPEKSFLRTQPMVVKRSAEELRMMRILKETFLTAMCSEAKMQRSVKRWMHWKRQAGKAERAMWM